MAGIVDQCGGDGGIAGHNADGPQTPLLSRPVEPSLRSSQIRKGISYGGRPLLAGDCSSGGEAVRARIPGIARCRAVRAPRILARCRQD